jgi:hypothetical protein
MRVVQLRRGRIVKITAISVFSLGVLFLLVKQFGPANLDRINTESFASGLVGPKERKSGQSYPDDLPVFRDDKSVGNYEPSVSEKVKTLTHFRYEGSVI